MACSSSAAAPTVRVAIIGVFYDCLSVDAAVRRQCLSSSSAVGTFMAAIDVTSLSLPPASSPFGGDAPRPK